MPSVTSRAVSRAAVVAFGVAALASSAEASGASIDAAAQRQSALVTIQLRQPQQTITGFGVSAGPWLDPHLSNFPRTMVPATAQEKILKALFGDLRLTRLRPLLGPNVEPVNDNADPSSADVRRFNFSGKNADALIALVRQARPYGLRTFFPSPVAIERWMTEANPEEYVEWALTMLLHWRSLGAEPQFYSPLNEPGTAFAGRRSPAWLRAVVVGLGRRMRAEGLKTRLVVPDDVNPTQAYARARAVLEDPAARQYVAAVAYHLYGRQSGDVARIRVLAARYRLPIWMTEFSEPSYARWPGALRWAETMHEQLTTGSASAVDFMWGYFGSWQLPSTLISIEFDNGVYRSHAPTDAYHVMRQFSRFVRVGDKRVAAVSSSDQVLVTAFKNGRRLVIVAVNRGASRETVRFALRGGSLVGSTVRVRTAARERSRTLPSIRPRGVSFSQSLPPSSVTTFVNAVRAAG